MGKEIIFFNQISRESLLKEKDKFGALRKHFDGYVYIRHSTPLKKVESYPHLYMGNYVRKNIKRIENIIDKNT